MTMRDRIAQGKLFTDYCEGLPEDRTAAKKLMKQFNETDADEIPKRMEILAKILRTEPTAWIEPPFYFCYGYNIEFKGMSYVNFNCNFVDDGKIIIGDKVMFGPGCTIATVGHPLHPSMREYMYTASVTIEDNCWIGANVTICPGVTIGQGSVIGAGSVVTKDVPPMSVAAGNPCKVIREITEEDKKYYFRDIEITEEDLEEERKLR